MENLEVLAGKLYEAKRAEDKAKKERIAIEDMICNQVDTGDNGSKTVEATEGLKVVVKRALSYTADLNGIQKATENIADVNLIPIKVVPESLAFDQKAYEDLRETEPSLYAELAKHVVTKPKKPSVTLKLA